MTRIESPVDSASTAPTDLLRSRSWLVVASATTLVIAFAAGRGINRGYEPLGDNGLVENRAWDVLTEHHPLLGTWSSASVASGRDVNHPGPLLFDYFALPVRLLGGRIGLAVGAAALNIAAVWISVLVARRIGGTTTALGTAVALAVLVWTLGSELLYDVWQPNILVLPFVSFLVLVWAVAAGHAWALVGAVAVGSLCLQAHLSYVLLVPGLLLVGVGVLYARDRTRSFVRDWRPLAGAAVTGLVLWSQPLVEQFANGRDGNLARIASSASGGDGPSTGASLALRVVAAVIAVPPALARPGFDSAVPLTRWSDTPSGPELRVDVPSLGLSLVALLVWGVILALLVTAARRRGEETVWIGAVVTGGAVVVGFVTALITPIDVLGFSPHKFRWLWSLSAFSLALMLSAVIVVASTTARQARLWHGLLAGGAVVLIAATIPTYVPAAGPVDQQWAMPAVETLRAQLDDQPLDGTVLVDPEGLFFAEPYSYPVMAQLARDGTTFVVESPILVRQVGADRRFDGTADARLFFRVGEDAAATPQGARRVAFYPGDDVGPAIAVLVEPFEPPDG